jgi:hypothetical protein
MRRTDASLFATLACGLVAWGISGVALPTTAAASCGDYLILSGEDPHAVSPSMPGEFDAETGLPVQHPAAPCRGAHCSKKHGTAPGPVPPPVAPVRQMPGCTATLIELPALDLTCGICEAVVACPIFLGQGIFRPPRASG